MKARKYFPILILLLVIAGVQQLTQMTGTVYYTKNGHKLRFLIYYSKG
jgi:hypothetical protein